jgi:pimeloyl-ACP methyl ester carboxylesterase
LHGLADSPADLTAFMLDHGDGTGQPGLVGQAPRSWAERAYPKNLIHYNKLGRGGHFAAWEQPDLFAAEMRAAFRSLR